MGATPAKPAPAEPDAADRVLLAPWRLRHASTDALGAWHQAPLAEAGLCAFTAIALDPSVLHRLAPPVAARLAAQASCYVSANLADDPAGTSLRAATARVVRTSVWAWQRSQPGRPDALAALAEPAPPATEAPPPAEEAAAATMWQSALRNFPQFDGLTGRAAAELVGRSEGTVLAQAREPWNQVLALGTLRYAARVTRGELTQDPLDAAELLAAVRAVQRFAEQSGLSPMRVAYASRFGTPALLAANLSRDAATLAALVGAADSPERADIWAQAEAMHAFAAVALDRDVLQTLDLAESLRLAAAAIRFAGLAGGDPPVPMPLLPRDCMSSVDDVAATARASLLAEETFTPG